MYNFKRKENAAIPPHPQGASPRDYTVVGFPCRLIYGQCRLETRQMIENELNLKYVTWGISTSDWKGQGIDMKKVHKCLNRKLPETTMVLMHVNPGTADTLDEFIDFLKLQGITILNFS